MVKVLTSDLRISFWEGHYPPLLVSASSTLAGFFTVFLKAHSPRLRFSNILNFKTLWNARAGVLCVHGYFRKSLTTRRVIVFGGHRFFSGL